MKKSEIASAMGGFLGKVGMGLRRSSPTILIVSGVIGLVGGAVLACRATLTANEVVVKAKEDIQAVADKEATPEESKKETAAICVRTGARLAVLYLPSVGLGVLSIAGIFASHSILTKRNTALAAAFTAVTTSFGKYRSRLIERYGEEVDKELRYGIRELKVNEIFTDENGEDKKVERSLPVTEIDEGSDYARYFDKRCRAWEASSEYNRMFLTSQQNLANDLLRAHGYLFLNDVYGMLGIQRSIPGQVVGWVYDKERPEGDNFVDFGIREVFRKDEEGGLDMTILLDFNVDGNIWERARKKELVSA